MRLLTILIGGSSGGMAVAYWTGHFTSVNLGRRPRYRLAWRAWLIQAGVDVSPGQFAAISAGIGAAVWALFSLSAPPAVSLVPAVAGAGAPYMWFSYHRRRRLHEVVAAWPDGILHVLRGMRSGLSVDAAVVDLAKSGPLPLQQAFRYYEGWARVSSTESALITVRERLAEPISDKAIGMLVEASRSGTDVAMKILGGLVNSIRDDEQTTAAIRAAAREPKITAWAAFSFPWFTVIVGCLSPSFSAFYASPAGRVIGGTAAVVSVALLVISLYLAREAPEPRVVGDTP